MKASRKLQNHIIAFNFFPQEITGIFPQTSGHTGILTLIMIFLCSGTKDDIWIPAHIQSFELRKLHQMMVIDCTDLQATCFKNNISYKVMREEETNPTAKFLANILYGITVLATLLMMPEEA